METLKVIFDGITALGAGFAIVVFFMEKKREQKKNTIDAYAELQKEVFDKLYVNFTRKDIEEIAVHYKTNSEKYHLLGTYCAKIECFSVGVINKTYDWKTIYQLSHGFLDGTIMEWLDPMYKRKEQFFGYNPYNYTEKVIEKLNRKSKKTEREQNNR